MEIQLWKYSKEQVVVLLKLSFVTFDYMCPILPICLCRFTVRKLVHIIYEIV